MFILGGICFVLIGLIYEYFSWDTPLWQQACIASVIVTALEFVAGLVLNVWLGLHIWDYSKLPFNVMGQICLPFMVVWLLLSIPAILLDDWLRYWLFAEEKPRYKIV